MRVCMYSKLCPGQNVGLKLLLQPCQGRSCSPIQPCPQPALSASLPSAHPAPAPAAPSRDKPSTCPARPADKAGCEDAVSLPAFVAPHLSCSQFSVGTCQRGLDFHSSCRCLRPARGLSEETLALAGMAPALRQINPS